MSGLSAVAIDGSRVLRVVAKRWLAGLSVSAARRRRGPCSESKGDNHAFSGNKLPDSGMGTMQALPVEDSGRL